MAPRWTSFTATPIFNQGAIVFSTTNTGIPPSGMQLNTGLPAPFPPNVNPPIILLDQLYVPLHFTKISAQNEGSQVIEATNGSILDQPSNLSSGAMSLSLGTNQLSKIQIEGWVDSPSVSSVGGACIPGVLVNGNRTTFGELLAAYFEGRQVIGFTYVRSRPLWFRDSYGRVYTNPLIYDLNLQKVEAVPYRETYTMTLVV